MNSEESAATDPVPTGGPGVPRWVVMTAVIVAVLLVLVVVVMLISGGEHGPGRHLG